MTPQEIEVIKGIKKRTDIKACSDKNWKLFCYFIKNILYNRIPVTRKEKDILSQYQFIISYLGHPNIKKYPYKRRKTVLLSLRKKGIYTKLFPIFPKLLEK